MSDRDSRIPGFYNLPLDERRRQLALRASLSSDDLTALDRGGLDAPAADRMVENAVGIYALPLGIGLNFRVNGVDHLVPMAVEEPSVIAAASNAARMVRQGGGFQAEADEPIMTAQIEIAGVRDAAAAAARIVAHTTEILAAADAVVPRLVARGGGARALDVRETPPIPELGSRLVVHLHIDCRDAMGANLVNTIAESLAPRLAELAGGRFGLRILTNLCDRRRARATARVPFAALAAEGAVGAEVARDIAAASRFAEDDPYRAATHNKGIMNGVDAVIIATGNDWRGVEAGAHAYAALSGHYRPLATWAIDGDFLVGRVEMPMAVGTVGGTLQGQPCARLALRILGVSDARTLGMVIVCVGLASNLAALRALATEGIQRGHMALHRKAVAPAADHALAAEATP